MKKPVSEMTPDEYLEYLHSLSEDELMRAVSHDVKKVVSIAHGYISLMRLDIEEGLLEPDNLKDYMAEMESMLEKSYVYIDQAENAYRHRLKSKASDTANTP